MEPFTMTVVAGFVGNLLGTVAQKVTLEEPLVNVCSRVKKSISEKKIEERKFLNHDLERSLNKSFFKALMRINNEVIVLIKNAGDTDEDGWVVNRLVELNKQLEQDCISIEKLDSQAFQVELIFEEVSSLLNPEGEINSITIKEIEEQLINKALSYGIPFELYEGRVRNHIYNYMKKYFDVEVKYTDEVYKILTAQLAASTNQKLVGLTEDVELLNEKQDEIINLLKKQSTYSENKEVKIEDNEKNFTIVINTKPEINLTDNELFFLIEDVKDCIDAKINPNFKIDVEVEKQYWEEFFEIEKKLKEATYPDEEAKETDKRTYSNLKKIIKILQEAREKTENALTYFFKNDYLFNSLFGHSTDDLVLCFKNTIYQSMGMKDNKNARGSAKLECYTSIRQHPSFKIEIPYDQFEGLFPERIQKQTLYMFGENMVMQLPREIIFTNVLPMYLSCLYNAFKTKPELKEDTVFLDLGQWYLGMA